MIKWWRILFVNREKGGKVDEKDGLTFWHLAHPCLFSLPGARKSCKWKICKFNSSNCFFWYTSAISCYCLIYQNKLNSSQQASCFFSSSKRYWSKRAAATSALWLNFYGQATFFVIHKFICLTFCNSAQALPKRVAATLTFLVSTLFLAPSPSPLPSCICWLTNPPLAACCKLRWVVNVILWIHFAF